MVIRRSGASHHEADPLGQDIWVWDPYTRSKVESERSSGGWPRREGSR
jgi:hypothetical protein